jgi:ligand-binding sensor domain-containing protein
MLKMIISIFQLLFIANLFSQIIVSRYLTTEDGLINSDICAIHEDREGYMWFATMDGLSRWDGISFENFNTANGLPASQVYDILEDDDGLIYFPTYGGGTVVYKNGSLERAFTEIDSLDVDLAAVEKGADGNYYFGGYDGICVSDRLGNFFVPDSSNSVWNISKGRDGTMYFGTYKVGVRILNNGEWSYLDKSKGLKDNAVWKVLESSSGELHIGTNSGLSVFKDDSLITEVYENEFSNDRITAICQTRDGRICYGGIKGVSFFRNGEWNYITKDNGLIASDTWSISEDSWGQIYFGSAGGGVSIYRPEILFSYNMEHGLADDIVQAIYEDENGIFYFGTEDGLSILSEGEFKTITVSEGLAGNIIRDIKGDGKGRIFIGTRSGLSVLKNGRIQNYTTDDGLPDNKIFSLLYASDSKLYIATNKGIGVLDNENIRVFNKENGLPEDYVQHIFENSENEIEFATYSGVIIKKDEEFVRLSTDDGLSGNKINSIFQDSKGRKYYGTYGKGLNISDKGEIRVVDTSLGLSNNTISSIIGDEKGNIYIATSKGIDIICFKNDSITVRNIDKTDGLISNKNLPNASFKDSRGKLWFGSVNGVTCYDPKADIEIRTPPKVQIKKISIFDKIVPDGIRQFDYQSNFLTFEYIGIFLPSPEKVKYAVRLKGLEDNWEFTKERKVRYAGLTHGKYSFEIKAANDRGYWSEPVSYEFVILPPWYLSWWFKTVIIGVAVLILWALYRSRVTKILQTERLRTRIAGDLHDEIGSALTAINMGSQSIMRSDDPGKIRSTAKRIGSSTRELMGTFSDIVWSIESSNDTLGELCCRIEDFCFRMRSDCDISIHFSSSGVIADKRISSAIRQNVYLIFKEALNNSIKYSGSESIEVSLGLQNGRLSLKVKDNGSGFAEKKCSEGGHGMKSMKSRAEKISGELVIEDKNGITVELKVKL